MADMTDKEIALSLLDYIEHVESERDVLVSFIDFMRDLVGNQPPLRQILSDATVRPVLEKAHERNAELRQAILSATEQDAVATLLRRLTEK